MTSSTNIIQLITSWTNMRLLWQSSSRAGPLKTIMSSIFTLPRDQPNSPVAPCCLFCLWHLLSQVSSFNFLCWHKFKSFDWLFLKKVYLQTRPDGEGGSAGNVAKPWTNIPRELFITKKTFPLNYQSPIKQIKYFPSKNEHFPVNYIYNNNYI